jgi:hypothetical protein
MTFILPYFMLSTSYIYKLGSSIIEKFKLPVDYYSQGYNPKEYIYNPLTLPLYF